MSRWWWLQLRRMMITLIIIHICNIAWTHWSETFNLLSRVFRAFIDLLIMRCKFMPLFQSLTDKFTKHNTFTHNAYLFWRRASPAHPYLPFLWFVTVTVRWRICSPTNCDFFPLKRDVKPIGSGAWDRWGRLVAAEASPGSPPQIDYRSYCLQWQCWDMGKVSL